MSDGNDRYIIEYTIIGGSMKVTAFDPATLTEASIIAAPNTAREEAAKLAVRKLHYVLRNKDAKE